MTITTAPPGVRVGRWQFPGGRAAVAHARRTVHRALRGWGLGPAAGDLADHLAPLVQRLAARTGGRGRGHVHLRLELRPTDRLVLGEVHADVPDAPEPEGPASADERDRGIIALTYGRRPARDGTATWYTHAFTWWQPGTVPADR
ncbi:MAG TPA: hypothetical protein VHJ17_12865 [Thermomonospora sp.]|nr:hypothetical protein [Thermomonospora sp.]